MATPKMSVQFRDIPSILAHVKRHEASNCCIFHHDVLLEKIFCEDLGKCLNDLESVLQIYSKSSGIYTLRVYEDEPEGRVDYKTPFDAQSNFQLYDYRENGPYNGNERESEFNKGMAYQAANQQVIDEVRSLKTQVATLQQQLEEALEEDEQPGVAGPVQAPVQTWQDKLVDGLLPQLPKIADRVTDSIFGTAAPAANHSINGPTANMTEDQKIQDALTRLKKVIPNLGDVLQKLAVKGEREPDKLKLYVSML